MAQVKDPVCGMFVDTFNARGRTVFGGRTYYFCSSECRGQFEANPTRFIDGTVRADEHDPHEGEPDPPHTKLGPIVAPKFGAAGSGGAEYDPIPKPPDKRKM